jgi:predicted molibdopterin-dependent oxidoreductase YjgC
MPYKLTVNGKSVTVDVPADMPLLWVIREVLNMPGTKFGCGMSMCGACTVHVNGEVARSCVTSIAEVNGKQVTTIEGLANSALHPLQKAWMRLLPGGANHGRRRLAQEASEADRRADRQRHGIQPLSLRNVPAYSRGDSQGCGRKSRVS